MVCTLKLFTDVINKLERLSVSVTSTLVQYLGEGKELSLRVDLCNDLYSGRLRNLPTNIRLGWKGLSGKNTLAYYKKP